MEQELVLQITNFSCLKLQHLMIFVFKVKKKINLKFHHIGILKHHVTNIFNNIVLCVGVTPNPTPENDGCIWNDYGWEGRNDLVISKIHPRFKVGTFYMSVSGWDYYNPRAEEITFEITAATSMSIFIY
jgi:hypothetical protein